MQNYVQPGSTLTLTAPTAVTSGDGLLVGALFGVATTDAALGEAVEACLVGVYDIKKVGAQAWSPGDKVYWDDTAKQTTKTATANTLIGVAVEAVGSGADETTGRVRLDGCSFTAAAVQPAIGDADATNTGIPVNTADTTAVATVTELDAVAGTVNGILAALRSAGIIAAA